MLETGNTRDEWGSDYSKDIKAFLAHMGTDKLCVYGTLMKGEANHSAYLGTGIYEGKGCISGYDMYDLGYYPGIKPGAGQVKGELYSVNAEIMADIDRLEGEGSYYLRRYDLVEMENGKKAFAAIYVFNGDVSDKPLIPFVLQPYSGAEKYDEYVWYVSYGSNMLEERFRYYIEGGHCTYNGRT